MAGMAKMCAEQIFDFLQAGTRTGHLGTVRADGRAHVKPTWFVLEGTAQAFTVLLNTGAGTVAGRNLARDGRATISVDDPVPPFSFVIVEGTAELISDLDAVRASAARIGGRYMGADRAPEYGERNGVPGELLVRITPTRITAERDLAE
jgi:PPOX class probable F420-dependent enzyme